MATIVPGILTSDEDVYRTRLAKADHVAKLIQIDIIDGEFANNVTVAGSIIKKYPPVNQLEIQLMVNHPSGYIDDLGPLDFVSRIIFPYESKENVREVIYKIKKHNKQVGISVNPETAPSTVKEFFGDIDLFLILAGKPGFSGQELSDWTYDKIRQGKKIYFDISVEVDIGVNFENAKELSAAGADFLVSTSAIFDAPDFYVAYEKIANLVKND